MKTNKTATLNELVRKNNGYLNTSDAVAAGVSREYVTQYAEKNGLERVANGMYAASDTIVDRMFVVQYRYPKAILSHEVAQYLNGIAEIEPQKIVVTLPRGYNIWRLANDGIRAHTVSKELYEIGVVEAVDNFGNVIKTYDAERTICDLIRNKNEVNDEALVVALQMYLRGEKADLHKLSKYAKEFGVSKEIEAYTMLWTN